MKKKERKKGDILKNILYIVQKEMLKNVTVNIQFRILHLQNHSILRRCIRHQSLTFPRPNGA